MSKEFASPDDQSTISTQSLDRRWEVLRSKAKKLVYGAEYMRGAGVHYDKDDPFQVGGMAMWFDNRLKYYTLPGGSNFTEYRGADKSCAELNMMMQASVQGINIYAIAISGKARLDQTSKNESPVLDPCGRCREEMVGLIAMRRVITPATIAISNNPDTQLVGVQTVDELLRRHNPLEKANMPPHIIRGDLYTALDDFGDSHPEIVYGQTPGSAEQEQNDSL